MEKQRLCVLLLFAFVVMEAPCKFYDKDERSRVGNGGHRGDLSRVFTGLLYLQLGSEGRTAINVLGNVMYLAIDATEAEEDGGVVSARNVLEGDGAKFKFNTLPNAKKFLTSGGSSHGYFTHLGWDFIYEPDTEKKWLLRREILRDTLDKMFDFSLFDNINDERSDKSTSLSNSKRSSLGALLYYVHLLGDHESDKVTTAHTRVPILKSMVPPNGWYWDSAWVPTTDIVSELNKYIPILFSDQKNSRNYQGLMDGINSFLPSDAKEAAKKLLDTLFFYCPRLLQKESFAKNFYKKNKIAPIL